MAITRPMQRPTGVVLAVFLASAFLAVPPPPPAAAHTLTKAKATKKVRAVAQQLSRELDGVEAWEAGACERRSKHAFRCTYFLRFDDGDICGQRLRIYYRNHDALRLSVRAVSIFDCNL